MTVICWDGKTLASDRQITMDGDLKGLTWKIAKAKDGTICGAAGDAGLCVKAVLWVLGGMREVDKPPPGDKDNNADLLVVKPNGTALVNMDDAFTMDRLPRKQWAIGSGAQLAMGAMAMGATAERAVRVAASLSIYCGGGVDTLTPGKVKP